MWRLVTVSLVCLSLFSVPVAASESQGRKLGLAISAMEKNDWAAAQRVVAAMADPAAQAYVSWRRLRAGAADWTEYPAFLASYPDWPGLPLLRKVGEARIPSGRPAREIIAFFANDAPQTGVGAIRLAEAYQAQGQSEQAADVLVTAWRTLDLSAAEREAMTARYGSLLEPFVWQRTDDLIWRGEFGQAGALFPMLSDGQRRLAEARIALRRGRNGVTKLIDAVPAGLRDDPGLAYDRFRWRMHKDLYEGSEELLAAQSTSRAALGRPESWAGRREALAHRAMREQRYSAAYALASRHWLNAGESGYTDLEWLSGYLKLVYLDDPEAAVTHFRRLRDLAVTPITHGRVWYWLGRAHEANGNAEKAAEAYGIAARMQTSFYGQMAAERGGLAPDPELADLRKADWTGADFLSSSVFKAAVLLHHADERYEGGRFFAHLAETLSQSDQSKLGQYLLSIDRPNMALRVAKNAAALGRININSYYPVTELAALAKTAPAEFALAIARQETELNPDAVSPAGARGLMQVMPRTARAVARRLGMEYSASRMTTDWKYNATLGVTYLGEMLKRYDGSFVLAATAYNAGPSRADRWIIEFGDPRSPNTNTEQWIEKIPFQETRNYVQRVMESLTVYRARLTGTTDGMTLSKDLKRGG